MLQILRNRTRRQAKQRNDPEIFGGVYKIIEERIDEDETERAEAQTIGASKSSFTIARSGIGTTS